MAASTLLLALVGQAVAFPWVANLEGVDSSLLRERHVVKRGNGPANCPNNPVHKGAEPYTKEFPYCGAIGDTVQATFPCVNNYVPAKGDTAHRYIAPGPLDIRGPCPGINTAANHGFLSRDGITTYAELVAMQQNVYGVGYDLANLLAVFGVGLDGDLVTEKVSIGCDATSRTSPAGLVMKQGEFGLDGHDKFEGDTSLTRADYFTNDGDNFSFQPDLYNDMMDNYCGAACTLDTLAKYRHARWEHSLNNNPNFFYGPGALLQYGAAAFLYELFPSGGSNGTADKATMDSFFIDEKLPEGWFSRSAALDTRGIGGQIGGMYSRAPVPFGANTGTTNSYVGFGQDGFVSAKNMSTPEGSTCALYLLTTGLLPATINQKPLLPAAAQKWAQLKLGGIFGPLFKSYAVQDPTWAGCPTSPNETD